MESLFHRDMEVGCQKPLFFILMFSSDYLFIYYYRPDLCQNNGLSFSSVSILQICSLLKPTLSFVRFVNHYNGLGYIQYWGNSVLLP